jgi:hypothetical protein
LSRTAQRAADKVDYFFGPPLKPLPILSAVLWAVGRSRAEFPEFNSMRWGKRIATFSGVDINVPVEMRRGGAPVVDSVLIRSAERLLLEEIRAPKTEHHARVSAKVFRNDDRHFG